jgi:hypothetical protein
VQAGLEYFILEDNPHLKSYPAYGTLRASMPSRTEADGTFQLVVMPGRGVIGARVGNEHYRLGMGVEKLAGLQMRNGGMEMIAARPHYLTSKNFHTIVVIDPREGADSVTCEIVLQRGRTVPGKVVDPDGAPLAGCRIEGLQDYYRMWSYQPLPTAEFLVEGLGPRDTRDLLIYHEGKKLAAAYTLKPDETGPITVRLEPCGIVTGRLIDTGGLPQAEVELTCDIPFNDSTHRFGSLPSPIKTGKDGRFRADALVPGRKYSFHLWRGKVRGDVTGAQDIVVARGQTKDLGDVTVDMGQ